MDTITVRPPTTELAKVGRNTFLGVVWGGVAVSSLFVAMRLVVRWKSFKKLDFDDGFVIFAWVLALLTAIDWQIVAGFMYQFIAITRGQLWPPPATFVDDSERYFTGSAVFIIFFYTSLWAVKISFLLFFKRLGLNVRRQKVLWWCVFAFTIATYLSCIGNIQYSCLVVPLAELVKHCSNDWEINFQQTTLKFNCAVDVLTDLMIMSIPISMLWRVQIPLRKKVALTGIFSLTVITMVFAVVRVTFISSFTRQPEVSWYYMWSAIEQDIAIIVSCLASFRALFSQQNSRARGPKYSFADASRNLFLRGSKRTRPIDQSMPLEGLTGLTGPSTRHSTYIHAGDSGEVASFPRGVFTEQIVPLNAVYVKREVALSHTPRW